ncbi:hypothetical protein F1559_004163 [Cyanidiococcus yangmingshanensis]|uniref:Uncharacterized protein n=1 Tax=Cyanidiococcus yangmingshanensis TaxID=2690220 RepID=A0A7J7IH48_9RHOD|nr:hypothetical protein F1559_004163 [Cyanidiococcus yangmingshanensis]
MCRWRTGVHFETSAICSRGTLLEKRTGAKGRYSRPGQALARSWQYSSLMSAAMRGCSIEVIVLVGTAYARVLTAQGQHTEALELVLQLSNWLGERHPSKESDEGIRHQWDTFADAEASTATASLGVSEPSARVAREPIPDESPVRSSSAHDFRARQEMVPFGDDPLPGRNEPDRPSVVPRESGSMHATPYPRSAQWLDALVYSGLAQVRDSRAERLWLLGRRQAATQDWKMAMLELERACAALPAAAAEELRSRFFIIALKLLQRVGPASLHGIFSRTPANAALVGIEHGRDHDKVCGRAPEALLTEIVRSLSTMQTLEAGSTSHPELSARLLVVELLLLASRATSSPEQGKVDPAAILQRLAELAQTTSGWVRTRIAGAFLASLAFVGFLCYHEVEEWSLLERFGPLDRDTAVVIVALALLNEHHLRRRETSSNAAASPAERVDTTLLGRGLDWLHVHHADSALGATLMGIIYERLVGDVVMADRFYELGVHLHPSEPLAQLQAIRARLRRTRQAETTAQPAEWMQYAFYWQQVRKSGILWSREWCGGQNQNPSANIMDADAEG